MCYHCERAHHPPAGRVRVLRILQGFIRRLLYQGIIAPFLVQDYFVSGMASEERSPLVVIVDDDESMRSALDGLMKQAGFQALHLHPQKSS